jgi:hypothetical protein
MSPIDERLKSLNIVLPDVMPPVVDGYVPAFAAARRVAPIQGRARQKPPTSALPQQSRRCSAQDRNPYRTGGQAPRSAATSDVRGLLGRSRRPPIRGHTSSVPRYGLRGVGGLKQLPKPL